MFIAAFERGLPPEEDKPKSDYDCYQEANNQGPVNINWAIEFWFYLTLHHVRDNEINDPNRHAKHRLPYLNC